MLEFLQALSGLFFGLLAPTGCAACEKPLSRGVFCRACGSPPGAAQGSIDGVPVLAAGAYAPPLSTAIRRMKYETRPDLARPLSSLLFEATNGIELERRDAFVPVPLHRARLVERGFNQAALVASELARHARSSFAPTLLERRREMQHQARLGREARTDNAFGAFAVRRDTAFRRVVLVDDVVTTGATARACLAALTEREIQVIAIVALAHASRADRVSIEALSASQELRRWSWIAPDGKEVAGAELELVSRLKKGELPPTTLVWQRTWLEWIPALRVAELAAAFPRRLSDPPLEPKRSPAAVTPPARPRLPTLAQGSVVLPPAGPAAGTAATAGKAAVPTSFGNLGRARGPSVLGPHRTETVGNSAPPRAVLNTLADDAEESRATLRPPGAIPPPPRAVPSPNFDLTPARLREEVEALTRRQNPLPSEKDTVSDPRTPQSALPSELRPALVVAEAARSVRLGEKPASNPTNPKSVDIDFDATLGSTPFEVTAQDFVDLPPPSTTLESPGGVPAPDSATVPPARKARPGGKNPSVATLVLVAVGLGLAMFVLIKLAVRPKSEELPKPAATPGPQATAEPATAAPAGCGIVQPAARLAPSVHRPVAPLVTAPLDAARASIGFAETENDAAGLGVDLVTLDVERAFSETGKKPVRFVVPLALDAKHFVVDRDDGKLAALRTLDTEPRVAIGVHGGDWVRTQGGSTGVLWPGQAADKTTDPRIASSPTGHLVTFRRGGLSGQVLVGLLAPDGSARGELQPIDAPGVKLVGTPDCAISGGTWLVAFAGRGSPEEEWRVVLASGKLDGEKPAVRSFTTPAGGAGGSSIAPSVSGLGDGGFVLQWTEGKSAQYQVRVQRLNAELEGTGEPLLVSPKGANAGQGTVFARGPRVLSLFVQTTAGHDELWGTSIECP